MANRTANEIEENFNEAYSGLERTINAYADLAVKKQKLERTSSGTKEETEEIEKLDAQMKEVRKSAEEQAQTFNVKLSPALFDNTTNTFKLKKNMNELKSISFKNFAKNAVSDLGSIGTKILNMINHIDWLKKALNKLPGFKKIFGDVADDPLTPAEEKQQAAIEATNKALSAEEKLINSIAKKNKVNADVLSQYQGKTKKELDSLAEQYKLEYKHYQTLNDSQKAYYNQAHSTNAKQIADNYSLVQSLKDISAAKDVDKSSGKEKKGKDPILELWKNRIKYIEDFYKQYKSLLGDMSNMDKVDAQMEKSFKDLFKMSGVDKKSLESIGFNLQNLLAGDMTSKGLKDSFEKLKKLIPAQYQDLLNELQKKISDTSVSIDIEVEKKAVEDLKDAMSIEFDNYELSKTFKDLGLNIDLVYMVGGKPTTLDDVKKQLESLKQKAIGQDGQLNEQSDYYKQYKSLLEKITDTENKELQERIKNYAKYLTKAYGEQASYQLNAYATIKQIREDFAKAAEKHPEDANMYKRLADQAITTVQKELKDKMAEFNFKSVMESPLFTDMFQDLSTVSNKVLDQMIDKLDTLKANAKNLSISQIRQLAQYYEKIQNAKIDNSFMKESIKAIKDAAKLQKQGWSLKNANDTLAYSEAQLEDMKQLKEEMLVVQGIKDKTNDLDEKSLQLTDRQQQMLKMSDEDFNSMLKNTELQITEQTNAVKNANQIVITFKNANTAANKLASSFAALGKLGASGVELMTASIKLCNGSIDEADQVWLDWIESSIEGCANLAVQMALLETAVNSAAGVIGIIAEALTLVAGLFNAILKANDAKISKKIKNIKKTVEALEKSYENLSDTMDKAYNMDTYEASYREMNTLIDAEIRQYEQMIKLEKSKKDSDEDAIQDYEDSIADLKKQREELAQQRITDLGGFGSDNYRSDAEDFVSAWLDAFKETGDGLDELNDKWEEYMENLFIKQAAMKKAATLYSKAMGIIDDAIDKGLSGEDLGSYVDAARTAAQQASADLNDYLKALADVFGISQEGENTLSELQQGISDITESQAAAIEAYLNSIRFYVASQLSLISDLTATIREQYTTVLNPMLSVVKEIRSALTSFSDKLSRAFVQQGGAWKLQIC
jgi:hypothetical protein